MSVVWAPSLLRGVFDDMLPLFVVWISLSFFLVEASDHHLLLHDYAIFSSFSSPCLVDACATDDSSSKAANRGRASRRTFQRLCNGGCEESESCW